MATGGSTNSVLHIPALARQVGCDITPETFDAISRQVPVISTIYPNHPTYTMEEFETAGGLGAVVKELAKAGKIDASAKGMFGTIADKAALAENKNTEVIHTVENPIHEQGGLAVLPREHRYGQRHRKVQRSRPCCLEIQRPGQVLRFAGRCLACYPAR